MTIACAGLMVESITQNWEFWVPPLILIGIFVMWGIYILQYGTERFRDNYYLGFAMLCTVFHGVHESSFFDIALIAVLLLVSFSFLNRQEVLLLIFGEFLVLMAIQIFLAMNYHTVTFDSLTVSRIILHIAVVSCICFGCRQAIRYRLELIDELVRRDRVSMADAGDMEDFLTNVSHELRTPVNVVNGMSALILKKKQNDEVEAIHDAGLRLARQIEDIQDYTEIKRGQIVLEQEKYMIISLVNDVIEGARRKIESKKNLEIVFDLDPMVPTLMRGDIKKLHKILRHLYDNAIGFTQNGGIYTRIRTIPRDYGVNLVFEVTDTGIGMSRTDIANVAKGFYQANKRRDRNTGGIGLGLKVVYGFVHEMQGFVKIESEQGRGTTVRLSIPQEVIDPRPCLDVDRSRVRDVIFYVNTEKFEHPQIREFYRSMAVNLAIGLKTKLYAAVVFSEMKNLLGKLDVSHVFMGVYEYEANREFFDELSKGDIVVVVSAEAGYKITPGSHAVVMQKPLYGFSVTRIFNNENISLVEDDDRRVSFDGVKALVVDDEPMNLVVATGIFRDYGMVTDTALSGAEAIDMFMANEYDIIFMDHMMPQMDGVEAMRRIRRYAEDNGRGACIVALTANAISGAREMFLKAGFDGFISKPIDIRDFERVMRRVLPQA